MSGHIWTASLILLGACSACGGDDGADPCGNGTVEGHEQCDDGNRRSGDGCDMFCRLEGTDAADADALDDAEAPGEVDGEDDGGDPDGDGDGDGDAEDVEAEARDAADVEGGGCVEPPPGCDLAPQCGCPRGEKCTLVGVDRRCVTAGFQSEGRPCSADVEGAAGLMCVNAVGTDVRACYRFCRDHSGCFGPGSLCVVAVSSGGTPLPGVTLCSLSCDLVSGSGCPAGTGCKLWQEPGGERRFLTDCSGEVGTGRTGMPCARERDCAPGFFCPVPTISQCVQFCALPGGFCEGGYTCRRFHEPVVVGSQEYGYCY